MKKGLRRESDRGASQSIRPSARSAHPSQLGKAGLERTYQRVDLRFGHRCGERARPRADDAATFVVKVFEQRLESARLVGRRERIAVSSWRRLLHVHQKHRARAPVTLAQVAWR